jgi:HEPN domain-containing protein
MADPDTIRYLRIAQADLAEARRMVELSGFRDSSIGFLLQQACEKALKSWIHSRGGLGPFTHDLMALMDWLEESGAASGPAAARSRTTALKSHYRHVCSKAA